MFVCELSDIVCGSSGLCVHIMVQATAWHTHLQLPMAYSFAIANGMSSQPEYMPPYLPQFDLRCAVCVREPC